mmetsp:Transcript_92326/g.166756  ORF Transcript_92326/g.166756 Transcript_92326/m.166756 type:complete len:205 (-) Transcript_92326:197-811(-)
MCWQKAPSRTELSVSVPAATAGTGTCAERWRVIQSFDTSRDSNSGGERKTALGLNDSAPKLLANSVGSICTRRRRQILDMEGSRITGTGRKLPILPCFADVVSSASGVGLGRSRTRHCQSFDPGVAESSGAGRSKASLSRRENEAAGAQPSVGAPPLRKRVDLRLLLRAQFLESLSEAWRLRLSSTSVAVGWSWTCVLGPTPSS